MNLRKSFCWKKALCFLCQLRSSQYVGGVIQNRDALIIQSPEKLQSVFNIDVRVNSVMSIDTKAKEVAVKTAPEYTGKAMIILFCPQGYSPSGLPSPV